MKTKRSNRKPGALAGRRTPAEEAQELAERQKSEDRWQFALESTGDGV